MRFYKHFFMIAMALVIAACVGFTSCKDDDDEDENTSDLTIKGADWKFNDMYYSIDIDDYYDEDSACLLMKGINQNGEQFTFAWYPDPNDFQKGANITDSEFEIYDASGYDVCEYNPVSGSVTIVDIANKGDMRISFNKLQLVKEDDNNWNKNYPTNVTINGNATLRYRARN